MSLIRDVIFSTKSQCRWDFWGSCPVKIIGANGSELLNVALAQADVRDVDTLNDGVYRSWNYVDPI